MMGEISSSRNLRGALEITKGSYPWNVLTVEGLDIFPKSVLTQNKRIVIMKNLLFIRKIKRIRSYTRRSLRKNKKTSTPKKTVKMMK